MGSVSHGTTRTLMDAALNTWGGGVEGAGAKSPESPGAVADVVTATRRVALTPCLGSPALDLDPKRPAAAALTETAAEDAIAPRAAIHTKSWKSARAVIRSRARTLGRWARTIAPR